MEAMVGVGVVEVLPLSSFQLSGLLHTLVPWWVPERMAELVVTVGEARESARERRPPGVPLPWCGWCVGVAPLEERSGADPEAPEERGRLPFIEAVSSSAEYVGRTGTIGERQQTLEKEIRAQFRIICSIPLLLLLPI